MPIIRKIVKIGHSKAVFIPKTWLEYYEQEAGQKIEEVAVEVNKILKITPIIKRKSDRSNHENSR